MHTRQCDVCGWSTFAVMAARVSSSPPSSTVLWTFLYTCRGGEEGEQEG